MRKAVILEMRITCGSSVNGCCVVLVDGEAEIVDTSSGFSSSSFEVSRCFGCCGVVGCNKNFGK